MKRHLEGACFWKGVNVAEPSRWEGFLVDLQEKREALLPGKTRHTSPKKRRFCIDDPA